MACNHINGMTINARLIVCIGTPHFPGWVASGSSTLPVSRPGSTQWSACPRSASHVLWHEGFQDQGSGRQRTMDRARDGCIRLLSARTNLGISGFWSASGPQTAIEQSARRRQYLPDVSDVPRPTIFCDRIAARSHLKRNATRAGRVTRVILCADSSAAT